MKTKDIDPEKVRMLASFGCNYTDIGKYFECDESTIRKNFKSHYLAGQSEMKLKLRTQCGNQRKMALFRCKFGLVKTI